MLERASQVVSSQSLYLQVPVKNPTVHSLFSIDFPMLEDPWAGIC